MRRSRLSKKKFKSEKAINFLAFFVFAPIVAILIGTAVVKYIVLPQFSSSQKTNKESDKNTEVFNRNNDVLGTESTQGELNDEKSLKTQSITLEGFSIYNIQLGSFSTSENANSFIKKLAEEDIGGYIVDLDGYKVFGGSYFIREEAEDYLKEIRKYYEDSFINTLDITGKEINYYAEDMEYSKKLLEIHDLIKKSYAEEVSLWKASIESYDKDILKSFLKSNTNAMDLILNFDIDKIKSEEMKNYFIVTELIITKRKELLTDIDQASEKDIITCYRKFMCNIFEYSKAIN